MPVGSGGGWQTRRLHFSIAEFIRIVSCRGAARFPAAAGAGYRAYAFSRSVELSRHPFERQFSELDDDTDAPALRRRAGHQRRARRSRQFPSGVPRDSARFDHAHSANRPVFHDRIRIGAESGGRSAPGIQLERVFSRDRDGCSGRRGFLCPCGRRGLLRCTVATFNWEALCNRHCVRTGAGSPMARPSDSRYGPLWAVPVFQRQLRGVEPLAVCLRPPPDDSSAFRHGPRKISDAFHGRSRYHYWNARGSSAGGRTTRSRNRSRLYGLVLGLFRCVSLFLDGRESSNDSDCYWAGNLGLLVALPDESSPGLSRPLFARRMDRPWDLGWSRIRSPRPELKWNFIFEALGATRGKCDSV